MKLVFFGITCALIGRSPHGERGLKCFPPVLCFGRLGRSPHGERGLKLPGRNYTRRKAAGRSPHGERGLKYLHKPRLIAGDDVAPRTGSVD